MYGYIGECLSAASRRPGPSRAELLHRLRDAYFRRGPDIAFSGLFWLIAVWSEK